MRGNKTKKLWKNPDYRQHMSNVHTKENPGYSAVHKWVAKWKIKPDSCEGCGRTKCRIEWANIDHKYRRILDDYIPLCVRCHNKFDVEHNGKLPKNQFS